MGVGATFLTSKNFDKSELIDHHPKMIIDFNQIEFLITTHSEGGITNLDLILASFIEETYNELFS